MGDSVASRREQFGRLSRWIVGVVLALMVLPASLGAQPSADSAEDVDKETAKEVLQLLRDGKTDYENEDYEKAYDHFSEAYDKWERPEILLRLGKSAEELGRTEEAIEHYRAFLSAKPDADVKPKIKTKIAELEKQLPAKLTWRSTPSGVEVFGGENGQKRLGQTPLDLEVSAGTHTYVFRAEGFQEIQKTVDLSGGAEKSLKVGLQKVEQSPRERAISKKQAEDEAADRAARPLATWGWVSGAAGVAGVGTGVAFMLLQNAAVSDVNSYERGISGATRSDLKSMKDQAEAHHRVSVVGFAAGGALTAAGAGMLIHQYFIRNDSGKQKARLAPQLGPTEGGGWAGFRLDF